MTKNCVNAIVSSCLLMGLSFQIVHLSAQSGSGPTQTARIVQAANSFLATLDAKQRQGVLYAFNDEQQRAKWSNFPIGFVPRGDISLKDMTPTQRAAAMNLVAVA